MELRQRLHDHPSAERNKNLSLRHGGAGQREMLALIQFLQLAEGVLRTGGCGLQSTTSSELESDLNIKKENLEILFAIRRTGATVKNLSGDLPRCAVAPAPVM